VMKFFEENFERPVVGATPTAAQARN